MLTNLSLHLLQKVLQGYTTEIQNSTVRTQTETETSTRRGPQQISATLENVESILEMGQSCITMDPNLIAIYPQLADLARACTKSMIDNSYPISCIQRIYSFVEHFTPCSTFKTQQSCPPPQQWPQWSQPQPWPQPPSYSLFSSPLINSHSNPAPAPASSTSAPKEEDKPTLFSFKIDSNITKDKINKIFSEALKINEVIDQVLSQVELAFGKDTQESKHTQTDEQDVEHENYVRIPSSPSTQQRQEIPSYSYSESTYSETESSDSDSFDRDLTYSDSDEVCSEQRQQPDIMDELDALITDSHTQNFEENDSDSEVPLIHTKKIPTLPKVSPVPESSTSGKGLSINTLIDTFLKATLNSFSNPEQQNNLPNILRTNLQDVCKLVEKNSQHSSDFLQKFLKEFEHF